MNDQELRERFTFVVLHELYRNAIESLPDGVNKPDQTALEAYAKDRKFAKRVNRLVDQLMYAESDYRMME